MIATIFRSRLNPDPSTQEEYARWAARMNELAQGMPGFVSVKTFGADDGERVTIAEFESAETLRAWSMHPEHIEAKKKGRTGFYLDYRVQVCEVLRDSAFLLKP
ncbi:MAG: antibiotic biosynthesis monooxygenase [Pseudomonadota bacterium]